LKLKLPELASAIPEYSESSFNFLFSANLVRSNITEQVSYLFLPCKMQKSGFENIGFSYSVAEQKINF
jgi:hypothetical protein